MRMIVCALFLIGCGATPGETSRTTTTTTVSERSAPSPESTNRPSFSEPIGSADDPDMDGLVSSVDMCPSDPEDRDGFEDEDGCPEPDNDRDGILDMNDRCPNEPETMDGVVDEDGCPDGHASGPPPTS